MLVFSIRTIPDLTLSKYQAFSDTGIEGMIDAQTQFIKQLYRISLLCDISVHFLFHYNAEGKAGNKLSIFLIFMGKEIYYNKIRKMLMASSIYEYFNISECNDKNMFNSNFTHMAFLRKKERFLLTNVNGEQNYFYLVPNWKTNEKARLFSMIKLMQSFNEDCCYRVDLYTEDQLEENIHKNFEKPLTYLRNLYKPEGGISEFSRLKKDDKDPNADEVLHQYEDWLKTLDASSPFRCRICVMADDKQYSQILLDGAIAESLSNGNCTVSVNSGCYSETSFMNEKPDIGFYSDDTPKSMRKWASTFTVEEIAPFIRLPLLYDGENIEIPKETFAAHESSGIILGKDNNNYSVYVPEKNLPKHMFVCGVPGSGKTNTMLHIANSLWNHEITDKYGKKSKLHIPFLVLEPAKREYRELALLDIPELLIFSPSACTNFPLSINPFEFAKGLTLSEHISKLCQVFEGAFPIAPPAPFILDRAIQTIYESHGWNVKDINNGEKKYPIMSELYDQFEKELLTTNYDSEIQGNIRSVLEMRIGSLLRREMKDIFDVSKSTLAPEDWLKKPVIIELEALGEGPANFVTLLLCTLIRETLKVNPMQDKDKSVRHIIFIEEAHNLIAPEAQSKDGMDSNPKIAATAYIVKMLAEVRALREGIIIADQLPTAMAPEVIKNTNIKLVHRLTSQDDRELIGATMSASPLQMENMATFTSGQALFSYEKLLRPFEMQVSLVEEHGELTPSDNELYDLMLKKPAFFELCKEQEIKKWNNLKKKVQEVHQKEEQAIKQIHGYNIDNISYDRLEKYVESCVRTIKGIRFIGKGLQYECSLISEDFVDKKDKKTLSEIINNLGNSLEKTLTKLIICF